MTRYDAIVIGGGLVGSAPARLILLSTFFGKAFRCSGGGLTPIRRRPDADPAAIAVIVEGRTAVVPPGASAAAAALVSGFRNVRETPVEGRSGRRSNAGGHCGRFSTASTAQRLRSSFRRRTKSSRAAARRCRSAGSAAPRGSVRKVQTSSRHSHVAHGTLPRPELRPDRLGRHRRRARQTHRGNRHLPPPCPIQADHRRRARGFRHRRERARVPPALTLPPTNERRASHDRSAAGQSIDLRAARRPRMGDPTLAAVTAAVDLAAVGGAGHVGRPTLVEG